MPRELITIQVGQCGNQIGTTFWEMALKEHAFAHAKSNSSPIFDEAMTSFFRNVKSTSHELTEYPYNPLQPTPIYSLRARAVCVDMEEGVLNQIKRSPMGDLFDSNQFVRSISGAGNNWAHGYFEYGPQYSESIMESVRIVAEKCDSLQSFFLLSSTGGGTGSGLGSYQLHVLADHFPQVYRFNVAVLPSENDDVITSSYNAALALEQMREFSDCVLPVDNQALEVMAKNALTAAGKTVTADQHPYAEMNAIVGHTLTSQTAPIRFSGALNVDLNELTMNLVPYPNQHFVVPSIAPLSFGAASTSLASVPRHQDQLFSDTMRPDNCLLSINLRESIFLSLGVFTRGNPIEISDINRNIAKQKSSITMTHWNPDGFKIGLCNQGSPLAQRSVLTLSNTCGITTVFSAMKKRFDMLYRRKAHVHHYTQYSGDTAVFDQAREGLRTLLHDYTAASKPADTSKSLARLLPI